MDSYLYKNMVGDSNILLKRKYDNMHSYESKTKLIRRDSDGDDGMRVLT
jgi:hypothetical protein